MSLPTRQRVSDTLHLIANLVQEADAYLHENVVHGMFDAPKPKQKDGIEPHKRDPMERLERKMREKLAPVSRDVLRARRERKARSRYQALKNVVAPPRKILGSRFRSR